MTFADFQSDGTTPDSNEAFKIVHKAGALDELNSRLNLRLGGVSYQYREICVDLA